MSIDWNALPAQTIKPKVFAAFRKILTQENHGTGWTLSELIITDDARKYIAYQVLEGKDHEGIQRPELMINISIPLKVLTRQACCRDKNGRKFWMKEEARETIGEPTDIIPEYREFPEPGDVVEWKGHAITVDPETGISVDSKTTKKWARMGKRPEVWHEYVINDNGCITVPFIQALGMLERKGGNIAQPRFRKVDKHSKSKRKLINWWFKEDPTGNRQSRKSRSDKGQPRKQAEGVQPNNEG